MKRIGLQAVFLVAIFTAPAQTEFSKIKEKHFTGNWYCTSAILKTKDQDTLVLYRNIPAELKDSVKTRFIFRKDDAKILFTSAADTDTARTLWTYVKGSHNLKMTVPVNTGREVLYSQSDRRGSGVVRSAGAIYLLMTITFHVEAMTEDKLVVRYTVLKKN